MKNYAFSLIAFLALGLFSAFTTVEAPTKAPSWNVDPVHSSISFEVRHFFSNVLGTFDKFEGEIAFDAEDLKGSSVKFTVDVTSVNTKNAKRDGHLQSGDFFNAEKWGTMTFTSKKFKKVKGSDNDYTIIGDLTIRDVTKSVEIPVKLLGVMDHMMMKGSLVAGFSSEFTINRNDFGVGTGDWAATAVIGDEVTVKVNLEVNRKKES